MSAEVQSRYHGIDWITQRSDGSYISVHTLFIGNHQKCWFDPCMAAFVINYDYSAGTRRNHKINSSVKSTVLKMIDKFNRRTVM